MYKIPLEWYITIYILDYLHITDISSLKWLFVDWKSSKVKQCAESTGRRTSRKVQLTFLKNTHNNPDLGDAGFKTTVRLLH